MACARRAWCQQVPLPLTKQQATGPPARRHALGSHIAPRLPIVSDASLGPAIPHRARAPPRARHTALTDHDPSRPQRASQSDNVPSANESQILSASSSSALSGGSPSSSSSNTGAAVGAGAGAGAGAGLGGGGGPSGVLRLWDRLTGDEVLAGVGVAVDMVWGGHKRRECIAHGLDFDR